MSSELRNRKDTQKDTGNGGEEEEKKKGLIQVPEESNKELKINDEKQEPTISEEEEEEIKDEEVERIQKEIDAFKDLVLKRFAGISKDISTLKRKRIPVEKQSDDLIEKIKKANSINEKKIKLMIFQHREEVKYLEKGSKKHIFNGTNSIINIYYRKQKVTGKTERHIKPEPKELLLHIHHGACYICVDCNLLLTLIKKVRNKKEYWGREVSKKSKYKRKRRGKSVILKK